MTILATWKVFAYPIKSALCKSNGSQFFEGTWSRHKIFKTENSTNLYIMSSSHRLAFMTEIEPEVKGKKTSATEQHHGVECKYVIRPELKNVNGKDRRFYYCIRSCHCGRESDHSNLLQVESENLSRMDGVEVHVKEDCKWVQPEMCEYWYIFKSCL